MLAGVYAILRSYRPPFKYHHVVARYESLVLWHPALAMAATQFGDVCTDEEIETFVKLLDEFRKWDVLRSYASQGRMARLIPLIEKQAKHMARPRADTVERMRDSAYVFEEVVPQIERHLENKLHNHIQDAIANSVQLNGQHVSTSNGVQ